MAAYADNRFLAEDGPRGGYGHVLVPQMHPVRAAVADVGAVVEDEGDAAAILSVKRG
jgi:hypothetical protein